MSIEADSSTLVDVDWRRVAEPQADQYDTDITLRLAKQRRYERIDTGDAPTCCDGAIAMYNDGSVLTDCMPAPLDHPNIEIGFELIRLWPKVFRQCQGLLDYVAPFLNPLTPRDQVIGSSCGPGAQGFGSVIATVNHHVGFAEAVVGEMSRHKLRALLGTDTETAGRLITNPAQRLYQSPIRYNLERPMSAVVQAQYSYTYVIALDLAILDDALDLERDRTVAKCSLAVIVPKLEFGRRVIAKHVQVDDAGAAFIVGLLDWVDRVVGRGYTVLDNLGIEPVAFEHPLSRRNQAKPPQVASRRSAGVPTAAVQSGVAAICSHVFAELSETPCRNQSIEEHPIREEMVLYCPTDEAAYALNSSSRAIWELCDGRRSVEEIAYTVLESLDCEEPDLLEALIREVVSTLQEFRGNRLIEIGARPSTATA